MTYLLIRKRHDHRYFVDAKTHELICYCGKPRYARDKQNKYGAHRGVDSTYNGYTYDSIREANHAAQLDYLVRAKEIKGWERQFPVRIEVNGYHICTTKVDFRVEKNDGSYGLEEVKGVETLDYKIKKKLIEAVFLEEHPEYTYTIIK